MKKSALEGIIPQDTSDLQEYLKLVESKGFHMEELTPIISSTGRTAIHATAGAGKSTALSLLFAKDKLFGDLTVEKLADSKKRAWVTTFLASGASEMERNIEKTFGDLELFNLNTRGTSFKTIHAEFLDLLKLVGGNFTNKNKPNYKSILDGGDSASYELSNRIFKRLFREYNLGKDSRFIQPFEINILKSIISRYRNTVITDYVFGEAERDAKSIGLKLSVLPKIVASYSLLKQRNDVIDFDDMVEMVLNLFCSDNPKLAKYKRLYISRYNYLLLDEAQDMSELQYLALKPLFENCPRVVLVGDPDQSIYSFRGANPDVMSWFERDFEPTVYPLSVSYRCPTNVMNPMARLIENNQNRYQPNIRSFKEGGIAKAYGFNSVKDMTTCALSLIDECLKNDKTVTVLSRVNFTYSPASITYTIKRNGYYNLLGDVRSLSSARYKRVWSLIELVRGRGLNSFRSNLKVLDPEITNWDAKDTELEFMNIVPENGNILNYFGSIADNLRSKSLGYLFEKLSSYFSAEGVADEMAVFSMLLEHVKFYGKSEDVEVVDTIQSLVDESTTVNDFFTNMDFVNNAIMGAKNRSHGVSPVTFATPFGFKGKESDVIIAFDMSDDVFPYVLSGEYNFEEERRVAFVTGTRARKEVYYLARKQKPSPFLVETGIPMESWVSTTGDVVLGNNTKTLKERMKQEEENAKKFTESNIDLDDWGL